MAHYTGKQGHEVFIGNSYGAPEKHLSFLKTIRLGEVALDIDGKRLPSEYRPIFISEAESPEYNRVMMARFSAINAGARP